MTVIADYQTAPQTITGSQNDWVIATTGMVVVSQQGDETPTNAITESGNNNSLTINGVVAAHSDTGTAAGVNSNGENFELIVNKDALLTTAVLQGSNSHLVNYGTIDQTGEAVAVSLATLVENHGRILGGSDAAVYSVGQVINDGFIIGDFGIESSIRDGSSPLDVVNHGTIHARAAIAGGSQVDKVTNDGVIIGNVSLEEGNDLIDTRGGSVKGLIYGGDGNDVLITDNAKIMLTENEGEGLDTVKSTVSYTLNANVDVLRLIGKANIDGTATDTTAIFREYLYGNVGKNTLSGLGGNDVLDGGKGNDTLIGGSGLDLFVFKKGYGTDTVNDFHHDESDHIIIDGVSDYSQIENKFEKHGNDTWVNLGHGDVIVIKHIAPGQLDHSDFAL